MKSIIRTTKLSALVVSIAIFGAVGSPAAVGDEGPSELDRLGATFLELPGIADGDSNGGCGEKGHCSYTGCPEPNCEKGTAACTCSATGQECTDSHGIWPTDDDKHAMYNCKCTCEDDGREPCKVYDPTTGKCLVN